LLSVDPEDWAREVSLIEDHFAFIGERLPQAMLAELEDLRTRLNQQA